MADYIDPPSISWSRERDLNFNTGREFASPVVEEEYAADAPLADEYVPLENAADFPLADIVQSSPYGNQDISQSLKTNLDAEATAIPTESIARSNQAIPQSLESNFDVNKDEELVPLADAADIVRSSPFPMSHPQRHHSRQMMTAARWLGLIPAYVEGVLKVCQPPSFMHEADLGSSGGADDETNGLAMDVSPATVSKKFALLIEKTLEQCNAFESASFVEAFERGKAMGNAALGAEEADLKREALVGEDEDAALEDEGLDGDLGEKQSDMFREIAQLLVEDQKGEGLTGGGGASSIAFKRLTTGQCISLFSIIAFTLLTVTATVVATWETNEKVLERLVDEKSGVDGEITKIDNLIKPTDDEARMTVARIEEELQGIERFAAEQEESKIADQFVSAATKLEDLYSKKWTFMDDKSATEFFEILKKQGPHEYFLNDKTAAANIPQRLTKCIKDLVTNSSNATVLETFSVQFERIVSAQQETRTGIDQNPLLADAVNLVGTCLEMRHGTPTRSGDISLLTYSEEGKRIFRSNTFYEFIQKLQKENADNITNEEKLLQNITSAMEQLKRTQSFKESTLLNLVQKKAENLNRLQQIKELKTMYEQRRSKPIPHDETWQTRSQHYKDVLLLRRLKEDQVRLEELIEETEKKLEAQQKFTYHYRNMIDYLASVRNHMCDGQFCNAGLSPLQTILASATVYCTSLYFWCFGFSGIKSSKPKHTFVDRKCQAKRNWTFEDFTNEFGILEVYIKRNETNLTIDQVKALSLDANNASQCELQWDKIWIERLVDPTLPSVHIVRIHVQKENGRHFGFDVYNGELEEDKCYLYNADDFYVEYSVPKLLTFPRIKCLWTVLQAAKATTRSGKEIFFVPRKPEDISFKYVIQDGQCIVVAQKIEKGVLHEMPYYFDNESYIRTQTILDVPRSCRARFNIDYFAEKAVLFAQVIPGICRTTQCTTTWTYKMVQSLSERFDGLAFHFACFLHMKTNLEYRFRTRDRDAFYRYSAIAARHPENLTKYEDFLTPASIFFPMLRTRAINCPPM